MKKIAMCFMLMFVTITTFAQTNPNTINVNGSHVYEAKPIYKAKMILSLNNVYYNAPDMTVDEIKNTYFENLKKAGIDPKRITEDNLSYALLGYERKGVVLDFETKSLSEMENFLTVKSLGVTKSETTLEINLSDEEIANYAKQAFGNAKSKAEAIAKNIGKKIGTVTYISDGHTNKTVESFYYIKELETKDYFINVSFELL